MTKWFIDNKLALILKKTQITSFKKVRDVELHKNHQESIKILGLNISDNLKWDKHINFIIQKCSPKLYFFPKPEVHTHKIGVIYSIRFTGSLDYKLCQFSYYSPPNAP